MASTIYECDKHNFIFLLVYLIWFFARKEKKRETIILLVFIILYCHNFNLILPAIMTPYYFFLYNIKL